MLHDDHQWVRHYRPPSKTPWTGRIDEGAVRFHQTMQCDDLRQPLEVSGEGKTFAVLGFASDEGVRRNQGRTGADKGPEAFRKALAPMPLNTPQNCKFYDVGDIACDDRDLEGAQEALAKTVAFLLKEKITPLVIGGGHEVAWGNYRGIKGAFPKKPLSIVNFDAHFDLREPENDKPSSGTGFYQMAAEEKDAFRYTCIGLQREGNTRKLFETAEKFQVNTLLADAIHLHDQERIDQALNKALQTESNIYLTLCLDLFAAPFAPGVSAPQPLGLYPWQVLPLLKKIVDTERVVLFDIAELNPAYDRDDATAKLAANIASKWVHLHLT